MEAESIPGNMHLNELNTEIPSLKNGTIQVVTEHTKYKGGLIAVNGLGISSSIGHILLKPNTKTKKPDTSDTLPRLVILSTRTEDGIKELLTQVSLLNTKRSLVILISPINRFKRKPNSILNMSR